MIKLSIPYKSHNNKYVWDYMTQVCLQINNINLANHLEDIEASYDNIIYLIIDNVNDALYLFVSLSNSSLYTDGVGTVYNSYCDIWAPLINSSIQMKDDKVHIVSFDIKKYNSVLSFSEDYQSRSNIKLYLDENTDKIYYKVSNNDFILLSPLNTDNTKKHILDSYRNYQTNKTKDEDSVLLNIHSVDKNSFLLPFMSYKDFLNFASYSKYNRSSLYVDDEGDNYFVNSLTIDNDLKFFSKTLLRKDKFEIKVNKSIQVSPSIWQVLTILQHFKFWDYVNVYNGLLNLQIEDICISHIFGKVNLDDTVIEPDYTKFKLVGKIHSNELFKINKLYSNASRTCYFDFSTQSFVGNNYIFNSNKLENRITYLENPVEAELPLKITFTEIKHYIGSDLSQKNFNLCIYTDGIRVMLERWDNNFDSLGCRVVFNHTMSRTNQKLVAY